MEISDIACLGDLLKVQADQTPDAIALLAPDQSPCTYAQLYAHVNAVAWHLKARGLGQQDRIAVTLPNGMKMATAFLAIAATATCAPLNPNYRHEEFDFYLTDLDAKALVTQAGVADPARAIAQERGIPILDVEELFAPLASELPTPSPTPTLAQPEDIALVLHTSGTTSRPKIVPLSHQNLCASARNICQTLALQPGDRSLNIMPLFHIHGLIGVLLSSLRAGASVVCTPGFYASQFFEWLRTFQPTWYSAVPTMHQSVLAIAARQSVHPSFSLRLIRSSSASLPPQVMTRLETFFNVPVIESYGMTEASHQMTSNPLPPLPRKPGSVGIAAGLQVAIMDEIGNFLRENQVGEVVIQGDNVTQGYDKNEIANASAFTHGWFRTGDLGYIDPDGYLFLQGRIKEIINRAGEKISPRELDEVLLNHPSVEQAVAFAMPDPLLGEDVAVAIVLRPGQSATEREIQEFVAARLADFKIPRRVVFLDEIPKGATGKLQRIGLANRLGLGTSPTL